MAASKDKESVFGGHFEGNRGLNPCDPKSVARICIRQAANTESLRWRPHPQSLTGAPVPRGRVALIFGSPVANNIARKLHFLVSLDFPTFGCMIAFRVTFFAARHIEIQRSESFLPPGARCGFPYEIKSELGRGPSMSASLLTLCPPNPGMRATVIPGHGRIAKPRFSAGMLRTALFSAIAMLTVAMGVGDAAAAQCPASPSYAPDFSANGSCLALNSSAALVSGGSTVLQITSSTGNQTGSAWYLTPQTVESGFTTTFQFQFTNPSNPPADGIAFVVQNSGTGAIGFTGGSGGAIGYGDADANTDPSQGSGIPNSLAIEFDTFQNGWDPAAVNGSVSHVAIQSCGTGPNTSHHGVLCGGTTGNNSTLGAPVVTANMADGATHSVTITYVPACPSCTPATVANIQVVLDGVSLYPNGVAVDLSSIGLGSGGTAYVGFTGATGGDWETQDIESWTFAPTQQGQQINPSNPGSLTQSFVASNAPGQHQEFDFDYSVSNGGGDLNIQPDTTPFVSNGGVSPLDWASIVKGTAMADAPCLTAAGQTVCAVSTLTCTTATQTTPAGVNCPQSSVRNVLFIQEMDLNLNQPGITNGILTVPTGYAPGIAMAPDVLVSGAQCNYPSGDPLATQLCPQSIMTQLEDNTPRGGGTGTTTNSSYVFFCCEPEWQTTPAIPLWTNSTSVAASFTSVPPATPSPDSNSFHAAQGASVVVGAEPRGKVLDTTYPLPGEQTLNNSSPCPALGASPTPWSTQNPQNFGVNGVITTYDNNGTASPLAEGTYDAHYFSVDCDAFEELVYPASLDVSPGTPGPNVATFKTVPFNIDTTKPRVTSITLNSPGGYYAQNSTATATVACTDPSSLSVANFFSGIATCASQAFSGNQQTVTTTPIPLNTSTIGTQTFTASASDVAGNSSPTSSVTYQVVGSADLATAMIGNLLVKSGTNMTYYIAVVNNGPNTADLVTLADTLPSGTTYVSAGYAIESCSFVGSQPICSITPPTTSCGSVAGSCSIPTLAAWTKKNPTGVLVQITVNVTAKANTTITDSAVVSEANSDPNLKNNATKWTTLVTK